MEKGILNLQAMVKSDRYNNANKNNIDILSNILSGEKDSPMFDYMMNFSYMRLSDIKSLSLFNESGITLKKNSLRSKEEILEENLTISLPQVKKHKSNIFKVIESRESVRTYSGEYTSLDELSDILYYSFGINKKRKLSFGDTEVYGRNYSSGGGLYPVNIIIHINKVRGIKNGLYKYQPFSHTLLKLNDTKEITKVFESNVIDIHSSNFVCFFQADIDRAYIKYGELSLLNIMIEIGIMSQNLHLVSKGLGYSSCDIAGFEKKKIENILELDGIREQVLYSISIGG